MTRVRAYRIGGVSLEYLQRMAICDADVELTELHYQGRITDAEWDTELVGLEKALEVVWPERSRLR